MTVGLACPHEITPPPTGQIFTKFDIFEGFFENPSRIFKFH
jgi:hypothetical protein